MRTFFIFLFSILLVLPAHSFSLRAMGMGNVYPLVARDPSGIFYNPAYLAKCDGVRLSVDNIAGPAFPKDNISLSIGDLGFAHSLGSQGDYYYLAQGFNTYSFLRLGFGIKALNQKKDFDLGFSASLSKNIELAGVLANEENSVAPQSSSGTLTFKTEDGDKSLSVCFDMLMRMRAGYENQFSSKAFWRVGYNENHPTAGLTLPLGQNIDLDLAVDMTQSNSTFLFGFELFRNTENKRVNSNHSVNFGKALVGKDKFEVIDGYNIHYVDSGSGFPLVLIGGGIHYTHHWDPYVKELSKHFRVINIDHVGAGDSDKPDYFFGYTVEEQAAIINELLERIGIKEANLLGYCYGGSIAFYLAGCYPERYKKLVEIEGFVLGANTIPINDKRRSEVVRMKHKIEYLSAYGARDIVTADYRLLYPYFNGKMWYQVNKDVFNQDLREEVRASKASVLYYSGTESWAKDFIGPTKEYIKANIKDLRFVEVEGAGHDVDRFDQEKFLNEILAFYLKE